MQVMVKPYMPSTKAISPRKTSHKSPLHSAPTAPVHTLLAMTTALHEMLSARAVLKEVTGMQSATVLILPANNLLRLMELRRPPYCPHCGKGKKADMVQINIEEAPTCDELCVDAVNCGTVGDTHPEEIVVDDVCAPWCSEAYTMVQLPANVSSKRTASLCIKVDTGAGGNMLPLHVFQQHYPHWISPDGLPTGLDHVSTRLTVYNGFHILLYGALHGSITWWPGGLGTQPHKVNSYWYTADTPSPAILGLPSWKRLAVAKMNCAITVIQPDPKLPNPAPAPTATAVKPTATPAAAKPIKSTDDLMKEFPD